MSDDAYINDSERNLYRDGEIHIYDDTAFAAMRKAGQLTAMALDEVAKIIEPGITTDILDQFVMEFASKHNAIPAPLYYRGYPKAICTSVNHTVCHGIPGNRKLHNGDIVNVDITLIVDGWHGDSSRMFAIGAINRKAQRLIDVTYQSLFKGIEVARPGATTGDIGAAIQNYVEGNGMSVVRDFCGHGIGLLFHDEPNIMHFGTAGAGPELKPGMIFTIEPMVNLGKYDVKLLADGWAAVTRDKSLSAQFEHTIGITATGNEIFTLSPAGR